jgi:hypothetical protein
MKFIRPRRRRQPRRRVTARTARTYSFRLTEGEKEMLLTILKLYPVMDASHHQLSRGPQSIRPEQQEWLEEAMQAQREEHRQKVACFFQPRARFFKTGKAGPRLVLKGEEMEWLLRVLNDIRVGSWIRLGRPEMDATRLLTLNSKEAVHLAAMELSGYFESALLQAFG